MIPQNELGVIVLFANQAAEAGFEIISIDTSFPDAIIQHNGQTYRAEFEYVASNFLSHKHDVRQCDLIICWENDCPDMVLPVLALASPDWLATPLQSATKVEKEAYYWRRQTHLARREIKQLQRQIQELRLDKPSTLVQINVARSTKKEEALALFLDYVADHPRAAYPEIGRAIGRSKSSVSSYAVELTEAGRLQKNGQGWEVIPEE